jgi:Chitobiase/beta-hexosaminidase C-terminal domain/CotH kinase protein/Lamin Tail Domain/NedA-like, galactose-binding domain/Immunoglobulin domain/Bacterial TSP3 repeat/Immunoglobulin I-set domain
LPSPFVRCRVRQSAVKEVRFMNNPGSPFPSRRLPVLAALLFTLFSISGRTQAGPIISEFMPDNVRILADEDGDFSDWIEIFNPDAAPVDLLGWYLTDDPLTLTKWAFPDVTIPPGGYLLVFASGKNRTADPAHLHTNFQLDSAGEFLALVQPDGQTLASAFNPSFPPVKEDLSFGSAQQVVTSSLLSNSVPQILVPAGSSDLPADWNAPDFVPGGSWLNGYVPAAIGFDTNQPPVAPSNLAPGGNALQSTTFDSAAANLAINGNLSDSTQTLNTDNAPFWEVTLARDAALERVVLRNRTSCCGSRLRDITVEILTADGGTTNFTSSLLNPENAGFTYPAGPAFLELDLASLTGGPVPGRIVRVRRTPDPDLSGSGGQGGSDETSTLSLGEVEVTGVALGAESGEVNLARTGSPAPTATQTTTLSGFTPDMAIDGDLGDFSHTQGTDPNPTWTLDLGRRAVMNSITIHNRDSCCGSRLRDITVQVLDADNSVVYTSPLLNPENAGYSFPNGPDSLTIDLTGNPIIGQYVEVHRTPDPDLSGTGGQGNSDEAAVLSLGEVIVLGYDLNGYRPYIRTDLQDQMLGVNASAFVRLPFTVADPASLASLNLRLRYDDGFVAYLNGVEVARRNAPGALAWNSTATASRNLVDGITAETIDLNSAVATLLVPGQNVLAIQAMNVSAGDGDFLLQPELFSTHVEVTSNVYLTSATPGAPNDSDYYFDEVADTHFSVDRGFFTNAFNLEITSATPGASIYYSFDCSEPGPTKGMLYTGPITITNTTVVRARAFRDGWKPTDVDTQTYLFVDDVIHQAPDWPTTRVPPPYFPSSWGNNAVDYGMDPNVVSQYTDQEWREALTQIPTMSIVTEMGNLFDPATGIYANAHQHGIDWERPSSLELIDPGAAPNSRFQENCGLRIRGGYSRNTQFVKHSFRVFFRREYGAPKLHYPLFEDQGADTFDTFDIRTSQNYSWPREGSYSNGRHDTLVREVWCRETLGAMGQPYRRSRYYHLYVNGQYWGLYETDERPEASFGETYLGGKKEEYDVVKCANHVGNFVTEVTDGNITSFSNLWTMARALASDPGNANYFRILGRNADGSRNPALPVMLDVDNLIDYMLEIFYSGDGDATLSSFLGNTEPNNWFGMKNRNDPDSGYRFFNSDCEHTLGAPSWQVDRTGPFGGLPGSNINNFTYANPQYIHEDLMRNPEYRVRFGDHVQKHFFNGGALTYEACTNRWYRKAIQIDKAVRAYSARWGDAVREPPYNESDWRFMISNVVATIFPTRGNVVLNQLINDGLYPTVGAPSLNNYGGFVTPEFTLSITQTNAGGTIYYTTDGTDPRLVGGSLSGSASVYAAPVALEGNSHVRARVRVGNDWSALVEATFTTARYFQDRALTEIMYNPPGTPTVDGAEFEFVELKNTGSQTLNLSGLSFSSGISFTFTNGTRLGPGAFFVLARNQAEFESRYPGVPVNGLFGGKLDNAGETLRLTHVIGGQVLAVTYGDDIPWPLAADGHGFSIVPVSLTENLNSDEGLDWRASAAAGGSPGADDPTPDIPALVVNEALTHTVTGLDFIELYNPTAGDVDAGGWFLSDDKALPQKFQIPAGTMISAGGYLLFTETDFNPTPGLGSSFTLNAQGDDVYLFSGNAQGDLTGYSHGFTFGAAPDGISFGRYLISTEEEQFPLQISATPGEANVGPSIGPVVLTEIHYHPQPGDNAFVELKNISAGDVDLFDASASTNTWRINGLGFAFPSGVTIPAGAFVLVVDTQPASFRAKHNVPSEVPVFGPYSGTLQNSGERLELQRPDPRALSTFAFVTVDEVRYNDKAPWPTAADGAGASLQRPNPAAYGNDPIHWTAAAPTPGGAFEAGLAPTIVTHPASTYVVAYLDTSFAAEAAGPGLLRYQWRFNGSLIPFATNSTLILTDVQPSQAGRYSVVVYNNSGSTESLEALLTVGIPATIAQQPESQIVRLGEPATFTVQATSASPVHYQWRFNGTDLPNATNNTYAITAVTETDDGVFTVVITDSVGPITSAAAVLTVLVDPEPISTPSGVTVVQGGEAVFSLETKGTLPMSYRWRRGSFTITNMILNSHQSFLVLQNVQTADEGAYTVVLTNAASYTPGVLVRGFSLTVLADADLDGIPDLFESAHGLNPNDPNDADLDSDGDGLTNREEYLAGTDPMDKDSFLRIEKMALGSGRTIEFNAVSNKTYTVQFKEALSDPVWSRLADVVAAASNRLMRVTDESAAPGRYYRLATPRQE